MIWNLIRLMNFWIFGFLSFYITKCIYHKWKNQSLSSQDLTESHFRQWTACCRCSSTWTPSDSFFHHLLSAPSLSSCLLCYDCRKQFLRTCLTALIQQRSLGCSFSAPQSRSWSLTTFLTFASTCPWIWTLFHEVARLLWLQTWNSLLLIEPWTCSVLWVRCFSFGRICWLCFCLWLLIFWSRGTCSE